MDYPKKIKDLVEAFQFLPGIGKKTAERLAIYAFSEMTDENVRNLSDSLVNIKKDLHVCPVCGNISETDGPCEICLDNTRDKSTVMVVEGIKDLFIIERTKSYKGVYHVLGGAINLASGVGVDDINISSLIEKVKKGSIKEIILATNATTEGETTSRYIKILLEEYDVLVTRIAHGLPFGGDISYADELTLQKALEGRRNY